ncbi:zinc finger protein 385C isoform X2 [Oxyura jamaicensis]|uniref:zinc finger protein 385C isoform X2 n=1 Tax=Oxyura jamaicensis TaxID=8884 RepID=UPI0015A722E5|nr:zinc finger protein 385C isoform X2 [Oxyura jamaicensis]
MRADLVAIEPCLKCSLKPEPGVGGSAGGVGAAALPKHTAEAGLRAAELRLRPGMKRPLSPSHSPENGLRLVEPASGQPEQRLKREKKQQSFTLCEVCNIQLNSAAQAQIHYNGKSHQKRLKQLNKGKMPAAQGPSGHSSPLLASLPIPGRPLHPPLDIKHFLTFRLNGTSPLNLFPNFNTMDPVQKAVISHTFGVPAPLKKKQFISCNICHLRFNSANQAEAHYKGHKHARRLKAIEAMKSKQKATGAGSRDSAADFVPSLEGSGDPGSAAQSNGLKELDGDCSSLALPPSSEEAPAELSGSAAPLGSPPASELSEGTSDATSVTSPATQAAEVQAAESGGSIGSAPENEKEGKKSKQHLYCPTCKVTVNSLSQLEAHNTGAKHKSMLEGHSTQMRRGRGKLLSRAGHKSKRIGNKGSINIQNKAFHCQVCEIYVNSETQLKQHMSSRRHKDRLAGKPPKPKYSPYNKLQKNAALASKLALQKHLTKTLATRFLPSPLTTAVCAMPGPLALRPAAATTLFQAPLLGPALFRTPPAHVRTTPGPIVFAPY